MDGPKHKYGPIQTIGRILSNLKSLASVFVIVACMVIVPSCERREVNEMPTDREPTSVDLGKFRWNNRLVLIFAPSNKNVYYLKQKSALKGMANELDDRDIIVFELIEAGPSRMGERLLTNGQQSFLRRELEVSIDDFAFILIGKDGTVKLRAEQAVLSSDLFNLIDSMPMRKEEMRRKAN